MRSFGVILIAAPLVMLPWPGFAQDKQTRSALDSSVQLELPTGNVRIEYVESREGMGLFVKTLDTSVRAQRLYLGDGKYTAKFEASHKGFFTPDGPVDAAAVEYKHGSVIKIPRGKREAWGTNTGEVYVKTPGVDFKWE